MTSSGDHHLLILAERHDGICNLLIAGELDRSTAEAFADHVGATVDAIPGPVLVDLSGLTFIDVQGARALAAAIQALRASRPVIVQSCPPVVRRVWGLLGLPADLLPAEGRAAPASAVPALVRQVQQARLDADDTQLDARWLLARLTDTCIRLASTQERNGLAVEQGQRTMANSRVAREHIRRSRPGAPI